MFLSFHCYTTPYNSLSSISGEKKLTCHNIKAKKTDAQGMNTVNIVEDFNCATVPFNLITYKNNGNRDSVMMYHLINDHAFQSL